ncbi:uncharacterized protein LOC142658615 isoform X2 [Rhinoderma darwinii]|uniref:uncharacterized protein LOC142658615 isoform X2 n=1 Tax=Rhinoderma darwinii TaxID=43563 RepID=UPI003F662818
MGDYCTALLAFPFSAYYIAVGIGIYVYYRMKKKNKCQPEEELKEVNVHESERKKPDEMTIIDETTEGKRLEKKGNINVIENKTDVTTEGREMEPNENMGETSERGKDIKERKKPDETIIIDKTTEGKVMEIKGDVKDIENKMNVTTKEREANKETVETSRGGKEVESDKKDSEDKHERTTKVGIPQEAKRINGIEHLYRRVRTTFYEITIRIFTECEDLEQ